MKRNSKKDYKIGKPKLTGKVGLLTVLMFLSAVLSWSKERTATVLRQMDQPHDNTITLVLLDSDENGLPDASLGLLDTNMSLISIVLKDLLQRGIEISFDDSGMITLPGGMDYIEPVNLLTVDGRDILDLFPTLEYAFPFAVRKRTETARQSQQSGGR